MVLLIRKRHVLQIAVFVGAALLCAPVLWCGLPTPASSQQGLIQEHTVVIDPGHGGEDGGAIASDGTKESALNLEIAKRLNEICRFCGLPTRMTRTDDHALCEDLETVRQRKRADLKARAELVEQTPDAVLISIHQNSLPSSPVTKGACVFWNAADQAEVLGTLIQTALNDSVNTEREKKGKPISDSIYLMRNVRSPGALIECGFLSNAEETAQLKRPDYQTTLSVAIVSGYLQWAAGEGDT